MERFLYERKEILKILIETAQDLSGAIKDLFKDALQQMINAEFDSSMEYSKYDKKVEKTNYRNGDFEPKIVSKNKRDVSGIEDKIISLYG